MKRLIISILAFALSFFAGAERIEGPFLILSTPYFQDGSVNYEALVKEARFAAVWNTPGLVWPQANDAIDLLTKEERFAGMAALVREWQMNPKSTVLTLGVSGDDTEEKLEYAREAERLAEESGVPLILAVRPPYYGKTEAHQQEYFDALAGVAKRPVILQTYVNDACNIPSVDFLVSLAKKYPDIYGWIKEESNALSTNDRQREEVASKPAVKTVFSAWGGWQWLYQNRCNGSTGLLSERVAYAPITNFIWECMKNGDKDGHLTQAYALYRLLIDQRFLNYDGMRGYTLHYFVRMGIFDNMVSRVYAEKPDPRTNMYSRKDKSKWKLSDVALTDPQIEELDRCYDDMLKFVRDNTPEKNCLQEDVISEDRQLVRPDNIGNYARTNATMLKGTPKGIVLEFPGLGGGSCLGGSMDIGPYEGEYARQLADEDILLVYLFSGPWSWMQKGSVRVTDLVVDAVFKKYNLPGSTPVCASGGSMGGQGAIMYAAQSRHKDKIRAIAAACPCYDLTDCIFSDPVFPRAFLLGAADQSCSLMEGLRNLSPIYRIDDLKIVPYFIACDGADQFFDAARMKEFADMLSARGADVTFRYMEGQTHGGFTPEVRNELTAFLINHSNK